jgi:hypothetical protein
MKGYIVATIVILSHGTIKLGGEYLYTAVLNDGYGSKIFYFTQESIDNEDYWVGDTLSLPDSVWDQSKDTLSNRKYRKK